MTTRTRRLIGVGILAASVTLALSNPYTVWAEVGSGGVFVGVLIALWEKKEKHLDPASL